MSGSAAAMRGVLTIAAVDVDTAARVDGTDIVAAGAGVDESSVMGFAGAAIFTAGRSTA
jgi:hypothetical protein